MHYYGSFGLSSNHLTYFFKGDWLSLNCLICCPCFFGMLSSNHSYICHLFLARWSPYFSQCNGTCWDWHFPLPTSTKVYSSFTTPSCPFLGPPLWKLWYSCIFIYNFFEILPTHTKVCHISNKCSCGRHANTSLVLCKSNYAHLVITHPTTLAFSLSLIHFFLVSHTHPSLPHSTIAHLSHCKCGHTIDDLNIHLLQCPFRNEPTTTHDIFQDTIVTIVLESGTPI